MKTPASHLDELSESLRRDLQAFEQHWTERSLAEHAARLPSGPERRAALVEMIAVDLRKRRGQGRLVSLDAYLAEYPELGVGDDVPTYLIETEYETRKQYTGTVDLAELRRRFPRRCEELFGPDLPATMPPVETSRNDIVSAPPSRAGSFAVDPAALRGDEELSGTFGRYRIERKLGEGGMGAVYLAHDSRLDRQVALKVPSRRCFLGAESLERFHREARAAATLHHPNLCPVYDVAEHDGRHYITMAFIEGKPLSSLIGKGGPLPEREVAALVCKLARAMQEAHARGIVHRDLKPANIVITSKREPVIMDFGLARRDGDAEPLTRQGQMMGTPAYMPPEQVRGDVHDIGPVSDVYSLGIILYELLTGRTPFRGSVGEILGQIVARDVPSPAVERSGLDPVLASICLKATARAIGDRFGSMQDFADALAAHLEGASPPTLKTPARPSMPAASSASDPGTTTQLVEQLLARLDDRRPSGTQRLVRIAAAALFLVVVVGVVYLAFLKPDPKPQHVSVHLGNIVVNTTLVYYLNGEKIDPEKLQGAVSLPVGNNELVIKRGDEVIEQRSFPVAADDADGTVAVPPESAAEKVAVQGISEPLVDPEDEKLYTFLIDGEPRTPGELKRIDGLKRGMHRLTVKRGDDVVEEFSFPVGPGDGGSAIKIDIDLRRVEVVLRTPNLDTAGTTAWLDDVKLGPTWSQTPMRLTVGTHRLRVLKDGKEVEETFQVERGRRTAEVSLALRMPIEVAKDGAKPPPDRPRGGTRTVRLQGLLVDDDESEVTFLLDGRQVSVVELKSEFVLKEGSHELKLLRPGAEEEKYRLNVSVGEGVQRVSLRMPDLRRASVTLKLPKIDWKKDALMVFVDGRKLTQADLKQPLRLLPGKHELLLVSDKGEARESFDVPVGGESIERTSARTNPTERTADTGPAGEYSDVVKAVEPRTRHKSAEQRASAAKTLGLLKDPTGLPLLARLVQDDDHTVRRNAADSVLALVNGVEAMTDAKQKAAMQVGLRRTAPALQSRIKDEKWYISGYTNVPDEPVNGGKNAALEAYRRLATSQEVVSALTSAMESKVPHLRAWACRALASEKADPVVLDALAKRIARDDWYEKRDGSVFYDGEHDPEKGGKGDALALLLKHDRERAVRTLCEALKGTHPKMRRWAADFMLVEIEADAAMKSSLSPGLKKTMTEALRERVGDEKWYEREFGNLEPDPLTGGKSAALKALRLLDAQAAAEPLTKALFSRFPDQRRWAAKELRSEKHPETKSMVTAALKRRVGDDVWDARTKDAKAGDPKKEALASLRVLAGAEEVKDALKLALVREGKDISEWAAAELAK